MSSLQAEREASEAVCVEAHPECLQVVHARRGLGNEDFCRRAPDGATSGPLGVAEMQLQAVLVGQRGG
jgi:hypothetical protein